MYSNSFSTEYRKFFPCFHTSQLLPNNPSLVLPPVGWWTILVWFCHDLLGLIHLLTLHYQSLLLLVPAPLSPILFISCLSCQPPFLSQLSSLNKPKMLLIFEVWVSCLVVPASHLKVHKHEWGLNRKRPDRLNSKSSSSRKSENVSEWPNLGPNRLNYGIRIAKWATYNTTPCSASEVGEFLVPVQRWPQIGPTAQSYSALLNCHDHNDKSELKWDQYLWETKWTRFNLYACVSVMIVGSGCPIPRF